jgi:ferritin-like protein
MSTFNQIGSEHLDALSGRIKKLENTDIDTKLKNLEKSITVELNNRLMSSQKALISGLLDVIIKEDKTAIKQLQQELSITAGQATKSANEAKAIAQVEIDAAIELLRSKSYVFAHAGE